MHIRSDARVARGSTPQLQPALYWSLLHKRDQQATGLSRWLGRILLYWQQPRSELSYFQLARDVDGSALRNLREQSRYDA